MTEIALRSPVNALVSYHYFANRNIQEMKDLGLRLIGDSGAFSAQNLGAPIDIDDFLRWGVRWRDSLAWVASLDVIGDAEASWRNYRHLRDRGLDAVPTIHYGCDPKELDRYAADGVDFVGLGGMVGRKSEQARLLRWTVSVFKYAKDNHPEMRFHGWGATHRDLIYSLPWFSVDSSGFASAYRYGRLALFNPKTARQVLIQLDGKDAYRHADLIRGVYGIDPSRIATSTSATRRDVIRISVSSVQRTEDFLRNRFHVTPPTYGAMTHGGSNIHVVDTNVSHLRLAAPGPRIHIATTTMSDYTTVVTHEMPQA